jgi:hypothetical protein
MRPATAVAVAESSFLWETNTLMFVYGIVRLNAAS